MATFLEVEGGRAKIRLTPINQTTFAITGAGVFYNIQKAKVDDDAETGDTTSTESVMTPSGIVASEEIPTKGKCMIDITHASYDPTLNLFSTPMVLSPGLRYRLEVFPNTAASVPYLFPLVIIKKRLWEIDATALQPCTLSMVSVGGWTEPT
jgi:hypothetical protein